jgi:hypothetical protein
MDEDARRTVGFEWGERVGQERVTMQRKARELVAGMSRSSPVARRATKICL